MVSSLRARTAVAAALAMTAVLAVGGLWLHAVLRANLLDNTTGRTELAARKAAAQFDARAPSPGGRLPAPEGGVDLVLVRDAAGRTVAASGDPKDAPDFGTPLPRPGPGDDSRSTVLPPAHPDGQRRAVVVVAAPGAGAGGVDGAGGAAGEHAPYAVYAMTVLGDVDDATRAIAAGLLAGAPPLVAFAAALAWWVTGHALRPVTAIRTGLASVTASELDRRVPDPGGADEIARLARTVNDTLDRLERSDARQRQFTADASHELRNPLAAVRSRLEVALAMERPDRASVAAALADTERLQRIAADLLLLARLDGGPAPRPEPVDLALLAAEDAARRPAPRVPLRLEAGAPVAAYGDPARLERALANLVDNALRHAAGGVVVRARACGDWAELEVVDDGPGIPDADRIRVFERFVRLDADRGRAGGGTGLGLAIAREIARAHGGDVRALPARDGGARLRLRVPGAGDGGGGGGGASGGGGGRSP
ncbi:HAMP domain-containing sensor histidine kinase [Streptomyces sp. Isolate_45]|uniref:sensor histidine kinase n=1 Tax=Streptomyces sp. Isolate_45 TaxID=2950111 RepID=UPI002481B415|nr:HAMP domain-containing sensor histidine kinase [Streptomyces sp. Isolate_45]MDA5279730.1 HAMP domain-containing sensor histidine kinase [Streptomyces sp. Isolate_45]